MNVLPVKFFIIPDFVSVRDEPAIEKECSVSSAGFILVRFVSTDL